MGQWVFRFAFMLGLLVPSIGHATDSELRDAYAAYQDAAEAGDLHAALPHAQRAYEFGLELHGSESHETGLLAFNLGYIENELLDYEVAIAVLTEGLYALEQSDGFASVELFDTLVELGRAQLGYYDSVSAYDTLSQALSLAENNFGAESLQAGQVHYLMAFAPIFFETEDEQSPFRMASINLAPEALYFATHRWRPVGTNIHTRSNWSPDFSFEPNQFRDVGKRHLETAIAIFTGNGQHARELASARLLEAAYELQDGGRSRVDRLYRQAIDDLLEVGYGDDFLIRLAITWINARHGQGWNLNTIAANVTRVGRLANLRREGEIIPLYRAMPVYPRQALYRRNEMQVCSIFTVTVEGRTGDIEIYSPDDPAEFGEVVLEAVSRNFYAPRMVNGLPTSREGVRYCFDFIMAN